MTDFHTRDNNGAYKSLKTLMSVYWIAMTFAPALWISYCGGKTASEQINNSMLTYIMVNVLVSAAMMLFIGRSFWAVPAFSFLLMDGLAFLYVPREEMEILYGEFASLLVKSSLFYLALTALGIYMRIRIYLIDEKIDEMEKSEQ